VKKLAPDDWRRRSPHLESPALERNLVLRDAFKPIAACHGATTGAVAVAWTASWGGTAAIVGGRSPEQVDGWIQRRWRRGRCPERKGPLLGEFRAKGLHPFATPTGIAEARRPATP